MNVLNVRTPRSVLSATRAPGRCVRPERQRQIVRREPVECAWSPSARRSPSLRAQRIRARPVCVHLPRITTYTHIHLQRYNIIIVLYRHNADIIILYRILLYSKSRCIHFTTPGFTRPPLPSSRAHRSVTASPTERTRVFTYAAARCQSVWARGRRDDSGGLTADRAFGATHRRPRVRDIAARGSDDESVASAKYSMSYYFITS